MNQFNQATVNPAAFQSLSNASQNAQANQIKSTSANQHHKKNELKHYEFVLMSSAKIGQDHQNAIQAKYEQILTADGGDILDKDIWGVIKLAYPIKKQFRGFFICYNLACTVSAMDNCRRQMRIDAAVLRHLIIKLADNMSSMDIIKAKEKLLINYLESQKSQEEAKDSVEKANKHAKNAFAAQVDNSSKPQHSDHALKTNTQDDSSGGDTLDEDSDTTKSSESSASGLEDGL